jgi:hypothetical protein
MSGKGEMTVREMGRLGGRARAQRYDPKTLGKWARRGGKARAERHTAEELQAFARDAGRPPYKLVGKVLRRLRVMLAAGKSHAEISKRLGVSLRTIGRVVARQKRVMS